jgi:hypothetical protein
MEMNRTIIEAAIAGFEEQKRRIDETIAELRAQLDGSPKKAGRPKLVDVAEVPNGDAPRPKRKMSAAARKRIAAGQQRRWAEHNAAKEKAEK